MKLVRETLNELKKGSTDMMKDVGIGGHYLMIKQITEWLDRHGVQKYVVNRDLTIDVHTMVSFNSMLDGKLPDFIQFGIVDESFFIYSNDMTTLRGCPHKVGRHFKCNGNRLNSLDHCPKEVGWNFDCKNNAVNFTEEDVLSKCKVGGNVIVD